MNISQGPSSLHKLIMRQLSASSFTSCLQQQFCTLLLICLLATSLLLQCSLITSCFSIITGAAAAPVLAPNISSCHLPTHVPSGLTASDCCAPAPAYEPRLFRPSSASSAAAPLRVRRPAHAVNAANAENFARAYTLMKALPSDDPRSFHQQANIHCAYCNAVYNQLNSSQVFQVHNSWLFFPFHRWYIYFHERILAKLLGDVDGASFAVPFWNYDRPEGASIPWPYCSNSTSPLYSVLSEALRDASHAPPAPVALDFNVDTDLRSREVQLRENDNTLYRALIREARTPQDFFGWPYRHDDAPMEFFGGGYLESFPHGAVHTWTGNKTATSWMHMGTFYTSGLDPLFYIHHAQIDRFWELWKAIPGNKDIEEEDYKNAEFLFYNEDGELVRVKAGDASNTTLLGYVYEEVETPWMEAAPEQRSSGPAVLKESDAMCEVGEVMQLAPCSFILERDPEVSRASPWLHDHLVLTVLYNNSDISLDIYLNLPEANATTDTGCKEYVAHRSKDHLLIPCTADEDEVKLNTAKLDISQRLVDLNLTQQSSIVVTLVPRLPTPATLFGSLLSLGNISVMAAFVECTLPYQRWDGRDLVLL